MDKHALDREAEHLFAPAQTGNGNGVRANGDGEALTRFVRDVRATFTAAPDPATRAVHLRAMVEAYRAAAPVDAAVANGSLNGSSNGHRPARPRRRRFVVRGAVAATALVLVGGSAMAASGTLPDVAQDAVASVVKHIGVNIPRGHEIVQLIPGGGEDAVKGPARHRRHKGENAQGVEDGTSSDDGSASSDVQDSSRPRTRPKRNNVSTASTPDPGETPASGDGSGGGTTTGGGSDPRGNPSGGGSSGDDGTSTDPGTGSGTTGRGDAIDGSPDGSDNDASPSVTPSTRDTTTSSSSSSDSSRDKRRRRNRG